MIRTRLAKTPGVYNIEAIGHARADVCCAASMIMQAAALGLRDLAKQYPEQIEFTAFELHIGGRARTKSGWTDAIDSTDMRPTRKRRRK